MLYTAFALLTGRTHKFDLQTVQNNGTGENEIIYIVRAERNQPF